MSSVVSRRTQFLAVPLGMALLCTSASASQMLSERRSLALQPHIRSVTMRLSDGEVVTIPPGYPPPVFRPEDIPRSVLAAVRSGRNLSIGRFRATHEMDDLSWTANIPPPSGGRVYGQTPFLNKRIDSGTGSSADHSTDGWYMPSYSSTPPYTGQGYVELAADMGLPTLYPYTAGSSGSYVYYAPTTQGSDGNPLEVGLATTANFPYAGPQHLFIYDWAHKGGGPCNSPGYPSCVGFTSYAPTITSDFTSKYVRVLSHNLAEW